MDTRTDPGQYYPGGRVMVRPDVAPPQAKVNWSDIEGKPDFSDIPELEAADSVGNVKTAVNKIVDKMTTAVIVLLCGICAALSAFAATTLNDMPGTNELYTAAETDAAIVRLAPPPGNYAAVSNAAMSAVQPRDLEGLASLENLASAAQAATNYTDTAITAATNNIPRPDMTGYVRQDENGAATLKKNGSDDGAIVIAPNTGAGDSFSFPYVRIKNPNSTQAYLYVGEQIHLEDNPNSGSKVHIGGNVGQSIDIGYEVNYEENRFIPKIVVDGTNLLLVIDAVTASNAANSAAIATMRTDIDEVAATVGAERTWNRPGYWTLGYLPEFGSIEDTFVNFSTNEFGMVLSNVTRRVAQGLSARMYAESLDEHSQTEPPSIAALVVSDGGTASNDVVTVPATGLYTVKGYAANGTARQVAVSFSGTEKTESASTYFADASENRKISNDFAADCLRSAGAVRSGTDVDGNAYTIYSTVQPKFGARNGWGNSVPYAIAPKFAATAAHYPGVPFATAGRTVTYNATADGATGTYTIKSAGGAFNLATWALTNGFLDAEVSAAGISDVLIIPLQEEWEFPWDECPWFATEEWVTNNYTSLRGMTIWAVTQTSEYGIPMTLTSYSGNIYWQTASGLTPSMAVPRLDLASLIGFYNERNWWRVKVGDSGKPLWLTYIEPTYDGEVRYDILLSHFHWVGGGPNYVKAARIVKALCQQYQTYINILE